MEIKDKKEAEELCKKHSLRCVECPYVGPSGECELDYPYLEDDRDED